MRPDALVVLGSSVTALAMVRSAHALGIPSELVDVEEGVAFSTRLARRTPRPAWPRAAVLNDIAARHAGHAAWLVATTDEWLRALRAARTTVDHAFARVLHPSNEVLDLCLDKLRFADFCSAHQLPAPRRYDVSVRADASALAFPVLLRPVETLHSRPTPGIAKALEVRTRAALQSALAAYVNAGVQPIVTQSLLGRPLEQYSVGISRHAGRTLAVVARKVRPRPEACRVGTLVETADAPAVEALARAAVDALGYSGIAEVEILRTGDDDALHLIEVNARPWVQFGIGAASGRDLLAFQLDPAARTDPRQRRVRWISFPDDLWLCMNREQGLVRTGRLGWGEYGASVLGASAYARWSWRDPGPFLHGVRELVAPRVARWRRAAKA
jgi:predicted ATP-grasp superfamily ATP-dependent carboligase